MTELPNMTVEFREPTSAHGITPPSGDVDGQLKLAIELNSLATKKSGWSNRLIEILNDYTPSQYRYDASLLVSSLQEICPEYNTWAKISRFVVDDMCLEFFNILLKYCVKEGIAHRQDLGFIDGSGIGYASKYIDDLKDVLEKTFDAKYFYKKKRPLVYALEDKGVDLSNVANAIHPGHWSYPAGHGAKFLCAVATIDSVFELSPSQYQKLLVVASVFAHGRSGNLIHFPEDNCAAKVLCSLR